ncbi:MAG: HPr family phosphocarrier protein [Candidatus Omnitrophica bacterium]|nr:HPr family phosphocarrier protein [Candidatus Omnitrophota bacterium]MBU1047554.1 HPr family phosphocarrier protein [Candidatus Omnitrophota bacterium]MBU1630934.1 HPr family phosphocarrier protein [Candidatus Omnitrophota bacterium]MBU1767038.1 HPr family phosphocarrier protein [Candidatus Omnitrophota bacterium]MBU1888917.1 HPr family phosphocarrier protein [Candidatus Omnitrophota bacterium]
MIEKNLKIKHKWGMHARPAGKFIRLAAKFSSEVFLEKDGEKANGKSILEILSLALEYGSSVKIVVNGKDEKDALKTIEDFLSQEEE